MMLINEDASSQPLVANATVPGVLNGGADPADESSELGATLNVVNLIAMTLVKPETRTRPTVKS